MGQPKPDKKPTLDQVLKLIERLAPDEKAQLRQQLDKSWAGRWDALAGKIEQQSNELPALTEEEVTDELSSYREEKR